MLSALRFAFGLLPLWGKAASILALLAVIGGLYGAWHYKVYSNGYAAAMAKVERQQKRAIALASKAREQLEKACERDSAACVPEEWFRDEE